MIKITPMIKAYTCDLDAINEICIEELYEQRIRSSNEYFGFKVGICGLAIHALMLYQQCQRPELKECAAHWINQGIEGIFAVSRQNRFIGMESAEIPWIIDFVKENNLIDQDILLSIDNLGEFVSHSSKIKIAQNNFDTCSGVLAEGFYLISKRRKTNSEYETLRSIINALNSFLQKSSDKRFFLGISHGLSGKILFLNRCIRNEIEVDTCLTMLNETVNKVMSHFRNEGSFVFPYQIGKSPEGSINCWSYGAPGIIYALFDAMDVSPNIPLVLLRDLISRIGRQILTEFEQNSDPGIWYGRAGLLAFLDVMHSRTGDSMLAEAAKRIFSYNMQHFSSDIQRLTKIKDIDYKTTFIHGMPGMYLALALHKDPKAFKPFSEFVFF